MVILGVSAMAPILGPGTVGTFFLQKKKKKGEIYLVTIGAAVENNHPERAP